MAEGTDCEIRGAFQNERGNDTLRSYRKKSPTRQVSTDTNHYDLRCLESTLGLRPSAFKEDDSRGANQLSIQESGTLSSEYHDNTARYKFASINSEPHVLRSSIETEGERCEIYDGHSDSLSTRSEGSCSRDEENEHADLKVVKGCKECSNQETIDRIQARFGKLRRDGYLGGDVWKTTAPQESCRFVHPHSQYTQEKGLLVELTTSPTTMSHVQPCGGKNERTSRCNDPHHHLILVNRFKDKSRIEASIDFKVYDNDPKRLAYYIKSVAEFGFNHIIIIGEISCGIIFLDCFGRVFQWDDESMKLWPLGDSPEEAAKHPVKGEDQLAWFLRDGVVYEYLKKWGDLY